MNAFVKQHQGKFAMQAAAAAAHQDHAGHMIQVRKGVRTLGMVGSNCWAASMSSRRTRVLYSMRDSSSV